MEYVVGILFILHGIAHTPGFLNAFRLKEFPDIPFTTTIVGGSLDVGDVGMKLVGVGWIVAGLACLGSGIVILIKNPAWFDIAAATLILSTAMSILGWPYARVGLFLNIILAVACTVMRSSV